MSEQLHVIAILSPAEGKAERLTSFLTSTCAAVHSKEPSTLRYLMTTSTTTSDIVMIETYKTPEANEKHLQEPHFKDLFAKVGEEGLLGKEPYIVKTVARAGFDLGRVLVGS